MEPIVITNSSSPTPTASVPSISAIDNQLQQLADLPPGPPAQNKKSEILGMVIDMVTSPTAQTIAKEAVLKLPAAWQGWAALAVVVVGSLLTGLGTGRYVVPSAATPAKIDCLNPTGCKCGCVQTGNCVCKNCDLPMLVAPKTSPVVSPVVSVAAATTKVGKVLIYSIAKVDKNDVAFKGLTVSVDYGPPYQQGQTVKLNGKEVAMPCAVFYDANGTAMGIVAYTTPEALAAWLKGK
jgi:hypothetical protein